MPKKPYQKSHLILKNSMAGFSLIESIIAILVISLGILGTSALLIKGMSNAKTASLRSVAAMQASSLAAIMYSNRTFWAARSSAISFTSNGATPSTSSNIDTSKTSCSACTPAQIAGLDVATWVTSLGSALPDAQSDVSCPMVTGNTARSCTIKISWTERFIEQDKDASKSSAATSGTRSYFLHIEP